MPFHRSRPGVLPALALAALTTLSGGAGAQAGAAATDATPALGSDATLTAPGGVGIDQPFDFNRTPGRLPKTVIPTNYHLRIRPDLASKTFSGTVETRLRVTEATSVIVLNALNLTLRTASLEQGGQTMPLVAGLDKGTETLRLTAPRPIAPGPATLRITYDGVINAQAQGLYYDRYPTKSGEKILLGTQFESTDARRLLPCWDEPVFRARFQLAVELPKALKVYSNTPVDKTEPLRGPGLTRTTFQPTPPMASYLLVLVAGELERIADTVDGTEVGVVFTEGKRDSATYALATSRQLLHFYNDYFGVKFPLPKLDSFAVPGGFQGAMENWGGITYNEAILLFDPKTSPPSQRHGIFDVMAHEMAHQWFGDLVTTAWWDDLWLNEGFASWMDGKATEHFNPDWDFALDKINAREGAMSLDARATSHPIQQPIANESDAADAFDTITYVKGESFLRMLENWLGPDAFRDGIRAYMRAHAYSSATTGDLWAALGAASGKPVAAFASAWTRRPGFPLITVDTTCQAATAGTGPGTMAFSQQRFRADPETVVPPLTWPVPLAVATPGAGPGAPAPRLLMTGPTASLAVNDCAGANVVDPEAKGYFRLRHAPVPRARLVAAFPGLPAPARLKLILDTWAQVAAGDEPVADYFQLLGRLGDEPKKAVWQTVGSRLVAIDQLLGPDPVRPAYRRLAVSILAPGLARLGWDPRPGEDEQTASLRASLVQALGDLDDPAVAAEARRRFQGFLADPGSVPPSMIGAVVDVAGRHADAATYDALLRLGHQAMTTETKTRYYFAAAKAQDPALAERSLALSLDPETPELVANHVVGSIAGNDHVEQAWAFTKAHGDALLARAPTFSRNNYLGGVVSASADPAIADDLVAYAGTHLPADAQTESRRTADAIRLRARTRARLLPQLRAALAAPPGKG